MSIIFSYRGDIQKAKEILKTIDSDIKVIVTENQSLRNPMHCQMSS